MASVYAEDALCARTFVPPVPSGWYRRACPDCGWLENSYRPECATCSSEGYVLAREQRRTDGMPADRVNHVANPIRRP
jgi:hypothetical protein